jgi:hypothetical protein
MKRSYLIYFLPFLFWIICYFGLSFDGLYGQDAYEYLRYTESLQNYFTTGKNSGDYFWGVYYPLIGSFLAFILGNAAVALQLISLFSLLVSAIYISKIIEILYKEKPNDIVVFLFFCLSPIVLIHSVLVMSDMLTCCFVVLSIFHFLSFLEVSKNKSFWFGVAFCMLAILTRYAAIVLLFPFSIIVLLKILKSKQFKLLFLTIPILFIIVIPHILVKSQNSLQFLSHSWLQNWNIINLFKSDFITLEGPRNNHFINLIYLIFQVVHPIFFSFLIFLLPSFLKKDFYKTNKYQNLILVSIVLFSLFMGGIPYQNKRYLLPSFILMLIFIYPQLNKISFLNNKKLLYSFVFLSQMSLILFFGKQFYDRNVLEKQLVIEMEKHQGKTLYVFDIDVAMQGRGLQFKYKNLFIDKYADFENESLVLINEKQLNQQWKGKNPLINWENIQKKCVLVKLKTHHKEWSLYEIINYK